MSLEFANQIKATTFMVQLHLFALDAEKIEIGVVLVLRDAEYLPPVEVKHNFPMSLVVLQAQKMKVRREGRLSRRLETR